MSRGHHVLASTEFGQVVVSDEAIVQIVGYAAAESYGVVALGGRVLDELERMIGMPVASLEVRIDKVRGR